MARRALARRMGTAPRGTGLVFAESRRDGRNVPGHRRRENASDRIFHAGAKVGRRGAVYPALHAEPGTVGKNGRDGFESGEHGRKEVRISKRAAWDAEDLEPDQTRWGFLREPFGNRAGNGRPASGRNHLQAPDTD